MKLSDQQQLWDALGELDAKWAILTEDAKLGNKWDEREFFQSGEEEIERALARLADFGTIAGRTNALDFGCGIGRLTQPLARRFEQVVGVDIAPSMIALASARNAFPDRVRYVLNEQDDLSQFPDSSFDFLYTNIVLQHIETRFAKKYIREFLRVVRPGGFAVFQLPEKRPRSLRRRLENSLLPFAIPLIPMPLIRLYRKWKYRATPAGVVEQLPKFPRTLLRMYGMNRADVEALVRSCGGKVAGVVETADAGPGWASFRYYVTR